MTPLPSVFQNFAFSLPVSAGLAARAEEASSAKACGGKASAARRSRKPAA
jgi:hypothetical protein